jgi:hypothetical protein
MSDLNAISSWVLLPFTALITALRIAGTKQSGIFAYSKSPPGSAQEIDWPTAKRVATNGLQENQVTSELNTRGPSDSEEMMRRRPMGYPITHCM